jgi:hypothetical protein
VPSIVRTHDVAPTVDALRTLAAAGRLRKRLNRAELEVSEWQKVLFGTDGVRGTVGEPPMTVDFALRLASAAARVLAPKGGTVLIGKDTRLSGYMFEAALEAGFVAAGVDVMLIGPLPTPGIAYLTRTFGCVSASSSARRTIPTRTTASSSSTATAASSPTIEERSSASWTNAAVTRDVAGSWAAPARRQADAVLPGVLHLDDARRA